VRCRDASWSTQPKTCGRKKQNAMLEWSLKECVLSWACIIFFVCSRMNPYATRWLTFVGSLVLEKARGGQVLLFHFSIFVEFVTIATVFFGIEKFKFPWAQIFEVDSPVGKQKLARKTEPRRWAAELRYWCWRHSTARRGHNRKSKFLIKRPPGQRKLGHRSGCGQANTGKEVYRSLFTLIA